MRSQMGIKQNEFAETTKPKPGHPSGLALIESLYFGSGTKAAREQLQHSLGPDQSLRPYSVSDSANQYSRIDVVPPVASSPTLTRYQSYNPPASWNAVYSLQLARFSPRDKSKDDYEFHLGEEIVIPIQGELEHRFFWSPGGRPPDCLFLNPPLGAGTILRVNPQIPHQARAAKEEAVAWLVLRHATNSQVALGMDELIDALPRHSSQVPSHLYSAKQDAIRASNVRKTTGVELKKPGVYAMVAWGISELIRDARQRTGRTTTDLANQIGIDPSSLSRLEEAKANVSIEMLAKVCRSLRIGMSECIESGSWTHESAPIGSAHSMHAEPVLGKPRGNHALHPYGLQLSKGEAATVQSCRGSDPQQVSSWIGLKGRVLLELPQSWGAKTAVIEAGTVIHFREQAMLLVHALEDSSIVQIAHSHVCECKPRTMSKASNGL